MPREKKTFTPAEWQQINQALTPEAEQRLGLPAARADSVVIGTFNIRSLGRATNRTSQARQFLAHICQRFDLVAIQEIQDDLSGIQDLHERLSAATGESYGMVISDVTGVYPGAGSTGERLAFLFNWRRIERTELASDITIDRSAVVSRLFNDRAAFADRFDAHALKLEAWEQAGKKGGKPKLTLPAFVTFIRQPHCASFRIKATGEGRPIELLAVNAHLLYGTNRDERRWEFEALIEWLYTRAKQADRLYHKNLLLLGDCNVEFKRAGTKREEIDAQLKRINRERLRSRRAAKANFPLLDPHPSGGLLRTNARQNQTYDQIGIFAHDQRLPDARANRRAGELGLDGYDYGVFRFTDLFAEALRNKPVGTPLEQMRAADRKWIIDRTKWDVSDHMPAWIRLPVPGA